MTPAGCTAMEAPSREKAALRGGRCSVPDKCAPVFHGLNPLWLFLCSYVLVQMFLNVRVQNYYSTLHWVE